MGQQKAGRATAILSGNPMNPIAGPSSFFAALGGKGVAAAVPAKPKITSTPPTNTPSLSGQESLGINSIQAPFGDLRGGTSPIRRTSEFGSDINLPDTTVGLTPGSEDKEEEEDTIKAPTINDEEKRREAAEKAAAWSS